MAKHSDDFELLDEDFELDDWGMGDDLDGGDFLSDTPAKNDRNPALRLGGKFVSGLGKTFVDPNVQRRMIKDNLPDGFGAAYDAGMTGVNAINDIKRDVDKNLGSIVAETKTTLTRVSPSIERQLPASLAKRLNEFTSRNGTKPYDAGDYNPEDQERSSGMSSFLEQVEAFKLKEESSKKNVMNKKDATALRNDTVQQRLLDAGNRTQMHTNAILNRILGYHTEVTTNYQMKSLELQYNQFFMLRKGVDLAEQSLSLSKDSYDKIIKNTGLPDALKLRTLEHAGFLAKENALNKLSGKFNETVGSFVQKGVKQFGENLAEKSEELKSAMADLENLVGMLDMLNEMEDEPPGAREQVLRQLESVFSMIGSVAGAKIEKIARSYAEKKNLKANTKLLRASEKIKAFMGNGSQRINSYLTGESDTGVGFFDNTLRGLFGGAGWSQDSKLVNNNYDNLGESSFLDFKTKRSINDVIPGYLKLIHHELLKTRTGDENVSAVSFDWEKNKFNTDKSIGSRLKDKFTGADSKIATNAKSINKFVESIDPGKELSSETRKTLAGLVSENMANGGSIFDVYTMMNNFNPQGPNAEKQRDELNKFMESRGFDIYADTSSELARNKTIRGQSLSADKFYNVFNKAMDQSRWDYESDNEEYQKLIDLGFGDQLASAGLVNQDEDGGWSVNQEYINERTKKRSYKGFATGGWTGPGDKYGIKGVVHGDEFVVRKEVTRQPGVKGFLDQLNMIGSKALDNIGGYFSGGQVQTTSTSVSPNNKGGVTLESIIEAIRSINPITELKSMSSSLRGIEFRSMRELMGNVEELPQQLRTFYESNIKNAKPGVSMKQTWDRFTQRAKQNKIWDAISNGASNFSEGFSNVVDKVKGNKQFADMKADIADKTDGDYQADVYSEDDPLNPKLTVDGFKNGEYFDELTGHPVTSVKDIQGTVVDKQGNIKLHAKELAKKLFSPSTYVTGVLKAGRVTWAMQSKALGAAVGFLSKHDAWGKVKKGLKWLKSSISHLNSDVYIKGQEEPVLLLKDLKAGNLYNGERKKITDYKHITGDIYDKEGNLLLAESSYADSVLVGADGKPLKGFMRKQLRRAKAIGGLAWKGVKGFNTFRRKAWQAQFKLMYGAKDLITGTKKQTPEEAEEARYNEWMMGNANPDGHDQYANGWQRLKGKFGNAQKATRDYLTGETDKRKAREASVGQLTDSDGNPVPQQKDAFDTLMGWAKSGKDKALATAKERLGGAMGTAQGISEQAQYQAWLASNTINNPDRETGERLTDKVGGVIKDGASSAKSKVADLAERARLEAWYLKNTVNNPDRETGETLTDKAKGGMQSIMKKVQESIPEWLQSNEDDTDDLKAYRKKLREFWIKEKREQFSGLLKTGKSKVEKINWKDAEKKLKSISVSGDDIRYEIKKFDMYLKDKGLDKSTIGKTAREKADKLKASLLSKMPAWMEEFTTDDDEVKRYKATLRKKWLEEEQAKVTKTGKRLQGKLKTNWDNAKKQLESMLPDEEQRKQFKLSASGTLDNLKKSTGGLLQSGKSKINAVTGKWGLDKDEKGIDNKQYRDKGMSRLVRDIHRLLDERLTKPKKGLWSDKDGNGFRDGSVEDQLAEREKNAKTDPETGAVIQEEKKPKGLLGILLTIAGSIGGLVTTVVGFVKKAFGFGKIVKDWLAKQAALKAASSVLGGGGGGCCCGGDGDDYFDRDERKRKKKNTKTKSRKSRSKLPKSVKNTARRGTRAAGRVAARGGANTAARLGTRAATTVGTRASASMATRAGSTLMRAPGWGKLAGLAALGAGGYMAMSNGASAAEVGTDLVKESYRATPGTDVLVNGYDAYQNYKEANDTDSPEESGEQPRGENPGFFRSMWNGARDTLGLDTADGVADFAKDTAIQTAGFAAVTGGIGGAISGTGVMAGALAALGGPITLGIIAGGAAIYGGIKLYQMLTKGKAPLLNFRMAQYGFKESSKAEVKAILKLEGELLKLTKPQGDTVGFSKADEAVKIAIKTLGIDTNSPAQMKYFSEWFTTRFKPVFFTWVTGLEIIKKGLSLDKVDDALKPQEKLDLLSSVHSEAKSLGAYSATTSYNADKALLSADAIEKVYKTSQNGIEAPSERVSKEKAEATKEELESQKSTFWEKTKNFFSSAADTMTSLPGKAIDKAKEIGGSVMSGIQSMASSIGNGFTAIGNAVEGAWEQVKAMSGTNKEKYNKIRAAAQQAGDPHPDIVAAQWALESGWGKKQSGKHNYFGIKAQKGESGTSVRTREVYNGKSVMINDSFKNYNSLEEGIADRVAFIKKNQRYTKSGYFSATTPYQAAVALQRGGYATDPNYANLLCKIIKGCGYDPSAPSSKNSEKAPGVKAAPKAPPAVAAKNAAGIPVTLAKPGTNTTGLSLDPSKKPNIAGMAMPGAPKSGASGAGILADPKKVATVGNTMGPSDSRFNNHRAVKAARHATKAASGKSLGLCARYVASALLAGGYKFTRQGSAYMYHTNGILSGAGMVAINTTTYQIGDVAVWPAHGGNGGGGTHGHIQIYNGKNWVSDFIQRSFVPGKSYGGSKPTIYRDKELLSANVKIAIDSNVAASDMTNDNNTGDSQVTGGSGLAGLATKYQGMSIGEIRAKRAGGTAKVYAADGSSTDYKPEGGSTTSTKSTPSTKTASSTNPNNTSSKPTVIPSEKGSVALGIIGATAGGKVVDAKKENIVQQEAAKKVAHSTTATTTAEQTQAAMRTAKMNNSTSSVGNTSTNFPAESIRLFTSMDSKLSQVVTALNKIAVISQDGVKAQVAASDRQVVAMDQTAKAMTTVATAAVNNKDKTAQDGKPAGTLKPGVIGAGKPQPVSVLS